MIPKIIDIKRLENKEDLWEVKLYTEITVFLSTEVLCKELVKQSYISGWRSQIPMGTIKRLLKLGPKEQILNKLNYVLVNFNKLNRNCYFMVDESCLINIINYNKKDENYLFKTIINLDGGGDKDDSILVKYKRDEEYNCPAFDTPWVSISCKTLKNIII